MHVFFLFMYGKAPVEPLIRRSAQAYDRLHVEDAGTTLSITNGTQCRNTRRIKCQAENLCHFNSVLMMSQCPARSVEGTKIFSAKLPNENVEDNQAKLNLTKDCQHVPLWDIRQEREEEAGNPGPGNDTQQLSTFDESDDPSEQIIIEVN